ncbi:hypothetical protein DDI_0122 [Dickeya dianthicola RNS04.9]|nr:hypothetical protein DDI_0122 [Dickeya dianthicola RNS04.9]
MLNRLFREAKWADGGWQGILFSCCANCDHDNKTRSRRCNTAVGNGL